MTEYIIRDFFEDFKRNYHKEKKSNFTFIFIYMGLYCIINGIKNKDFGWLDALICCAVLLPILFSYFSAYMHPLRLTKMMYLCPMHSEERKKYIYGTYFFRIGFQMLIAVSGICIAVLYSYCDIFSVIQILLNHFMAAIIIVPARGTDSRNNNINVKGRISGEIIIITVLISNLIEYGIIVDSYPDMLLKLILFIAFCLIQVPLGITYGKYIRKELQTAIYYERNIEKEGYGYKGENQDTPAGNTGNL